MSFVDLKIKKTYNSDEDDILNSFYIPSLSLAVEYNRLAGFFSSSSLAIAARGIYPLIARGGKIKLIASPLLTEADIRIIKEHVAQKSAVIEDCLLKEILPENFSEDFIRDHLSALGWMLRNELLEIKIAVPYNVENSYLTFNEVNNNGLFHQKVGILKDKDGNILTFSGSINESAKGWQSNIEEFKVFRNWVNIESDYVASDISKFNKFWSNIGSNVEIYDLPKAVKNKIIQQSPNNYQDLNIKVGTRKKRKKINLFEYQKEAINKWIENDCQGLFEMATGTGKTFTAMGCINYLIPKYPQLAIIISCPQSHLLKQWEKEIIKFNLPIEKIIIADSTNKRWKNDSYSSLADLSMYGGKPIVIITSHKTLSSNDFIYSASSISNLNYFLIVDEVHGIGTEINHKGLLEIYSFRLGLSATPSRWFDEDGSKIIYNYFSKVVFSFPLQDALTQINPITGLTYLCNYYYIPVFVHLDEEELNQYIKICLSIIRFKANCETESDYERLFLKYIYRANIIKNAQNKLTVITKIFSEIESTQNNISHTIIYCSPQQIAQVSSIVSNYGLSHHRFTMSEKTTPSKQYNNQSEREYILNSFSDGLYQVLIAMKCLDEGVDIPQAKNAILLSNSGNPREFIQRIGRIIRNHPSKRESFIYDIIVTPNIKKLPPELKKSEKEIFLKEMDRCKAIATLAKNNNSALEKLYSIINL